MFGTGRRWLVMAYWRGLVIISLALMIMIERRLFISSTSTNCLSLELIYEMIYYYTLFSPLIYLFTSVNIFSNPRIRNMASTRSVTNCTYASLSIDISQPAKCLETKESYA